jgi:hypothetical protein
LGKTKWRTEPTNNEKLGDELWVGVKGQSNLEIAGSLRNSFRASVASVVCRRWSTERVRGPTSLPTPIKLRMPVTCFAAVRQWGISFIAERETTQTYS